jgi:urease accessory protein
MKCQRDLPTGVLLMVAAFASSPVQAHSGHVASGLQNGLLHPLAGFDHLVAMVAIGSLAMRQTSARAWILPTVFVSMMAIGITGIVPVASIAYTQIAIAICLVLTGIALLPSRGAAIRDLAILLAGASGLFHGIAHAADYQGLAPSLPFVLGALTATALLHLAGTLAGRGMTKLHEARRDHIWQWMGVGTASVGLLAVIG